MSSLPACGHHMKQENNITKAEVSNNGPRGKMVQMKAMIYLMDWSCITLF